MSSTAMMVFPDALRAAGFVYRRAVEAPPKLVVVFGIWMHFFPGLLASTFLILGLLGNGFDNLLSFPFFLMAAAAGAGCGSMLYRVTRNYFTMQKTARHESAA